MMMVRPTETVDLNAENHGGGMRVVGGQPLITDCVFRHNMAWRGGGLGFQGSNGALRRTLFHQNFAVFGGGAGAVSSDIFIEDCLFTSNRTANGSGAAGGLSVLQGSAIVRDCAFAGNISPQGGAGGALATSFAATLIERCTFTGNVADIGGAISGKPTIRNCAFFDNRANWGGAIHTSFSASGLLRCFESEFAHNFANFEGGAVVGKGAFVDCTFYKNSVFWDSGGAVKGGGDFVLCRFIENTSRELGGGALMSNGTTYVTGCLFNANTSEGPGAAMRVLAGHAAHIVGCTFVNNLSATGAGAVSADGRAIIANSILWHSGTPTLSGSTAVTYSCIEGGWPGVGNIDNAPAFFDVVGPDGVQGTPDDDLRLSSRSPCIDAGNNGSLPPDLFDLDSDGNVAEPIPCDLNHGVRRANDPRTPDTGNSAGLGLAIVDIGAFEFSDFRPVAGDADGNGVVDVDDLITVILGWGRCPDDSDCAADVYPPNDGDGVVNVHDLICVIENWSFMN